MNIEQKCSNCKFFCEGNTSVNTISNGLYPNSWCLYPTQLGCYVPGFTKCKHWEEKFCAEMKINELMGLVVELGRETSYNDDALDTRCIIELCDKVSDIVLDIKHNFSGGI